MLRPRPILARLAIVAAVAAHGPTTSPRISAPALAARQLFQAWQAGDRVVSVNAQMRFGTPDAAARYLVSAWLADDRAKAGHAASRPVVNTLWSHSEDRAYRPRFDGCAFRDPNWGSDCAFGYSTAGLGFTLQVKGGANLGWQVIAIRFARL